MAASVPGHAIGEATMVHPRTTAALSASLSWIVLAGCATAFPPIEPQPLQTSDFVVYAGDSLVASERVNHYPDRIEGNIEVTGRARVSYLARLDSRNAIDHMEMQTWPWEGEAIANSRVSADFVGDSIFVNRTLPMASTRRVGGGRAVPYIHPSPGLLEQIVLRALRMGGSPAEVRVWFMAQNGATYASVSFVSARVADVRILGDTFRVWLDEFGLMLAEVPQLGWLIQRRPR
jgi:hypothetical protein